MRCKNCKEIFEPKHFNQKYCFDSDCVAVWVEKSKKDNWKKLKKRMKAELETTQSLMKKCQSVFNRWVRLRDAGQPCISCGGELGEKYDASHYFSSGGHKSVTFDPDNVHASCVHCNRYLHGNLLNYQIGIEKKIGGERLFELHKKAHETRKYSKDELRDLIGFYGELIKKLKKN
tara:strand:+ start:2673 stop:3197 length:525 start_codon:yes stop_codon:yes gene_type:complete